MNEFWYDYIRSKHNKKAKLCYMDTDSFIAYVKTEDIYEDIVKDVEKRFDTSNYELERPLSKGKKQKSYQLNPFSANFTKWSNTLKQFVNNLPTNCLSVFDHFVGLVLKGFIKDKLGGKIMKVFVGLRAKTYNYLTENNDESKKAKRAKKCVILRKLKFEDYKNCLEATQLENKIIHQSLIEKMNLFQYKNMMKLKKKSKILTKNA